MHLQSQLEDGQAEGLFAIWKDPEEVAQYGLAVIRGGRIFEDSVVEYQRGTA